LPGIRVYQEFAGKFCGVSLVLGGQDLEQPSHLKMEPDEMKYVQFTFYSLQPAIPDAPLFCFAAGQSITPLKYKFLKT
jgi:hypothetical protein